MGEPVDASGKMQPLFLYSFSRWVASHQRMFLGKGGGVQGVMIDSSFRGWMPNFHCEDFG